VSHSISTKPESAIALRTECQFFHCPVFDFVNQLGFMEESNSKPTSAIIGAIQGAI
jgi:hypothetical protein